MKRFIFLLFISTLFSSCAFHNGIMTGNAALSDANFSVVDLATGHAKTIHVLGIGGIDSDALIFEAKKNLYANHPLKQGQALANVTVDFKRTFVIIALITEVTVSAEVIDFNQGANDRSLEIFTDKLLSQSNLKIGSKILIESIKRILPAEVVSIQGSKLTVKYVEENDKLVLKTVNIPSIYYTTEDNPSITYFGLHLGDHVYVKLDEQAYNPKNVIEGEIVGLNEEKAAVKFEKKGKEKIQAFPISNLVKKK